MFGGACGKVCYKLALGGCVSPPGLPVGLSLAARLDLELAEEKGRLVLNPLAIQAAVLDEQQRRVFRSAPEEPRKSNLSGQQILGPLRYFLLISHTVEQLLLQHLEPLQMNSLYESLLKAAATAAIARQIDYGCFFGCLTAEKKLFVTHYFDKTVQLQPAGPAFVERYLALCPGIQTVIPPPTPPPLYAGFAAARVLLGSEAPARQSGADDVAVAYRLPVSEAPQEHQPGAYRRLELWTLLNPVTNQEEEWEWEGEGEGEGESEEEGEKGEKEEEGGGQWRALFTFRPDCAPVFAINVSSSLPEEIINQSVGSTGPMTAVLACCCLDSEDDDDDGQPALKYQFLPLEDSRYHNEPDREEMMGAHQERTADPPADPGMVIFFSDVGSFICQEVSFRVIATGSIFV